MPREKITFKIPGKAMLFGEYGVLAGGTAFAATVPQPHFEVCFEWVEKSTLNETGRRVFSGAAAGIWVQSEFLKSGELFLTYAEINQVQKSQSVQFLPEESRFWGALFAPFSQLFLALNKKAEHILFVHVQKSFSPALGLGSSSALLCAVHWACAQLLDCPLSFEQALASLHLAQGKGSGYDVAVQMAAAHDALCKSIEKADTRGASKYQLWKFSRDHVQSQNAHKSAPSSENDLTANRWAEAISPPLPWGEMGVLLESGIYSSTAASLAAPLSELKRVHFAERHAQIAGEFAHLQNSNQLARLMEKSLEVASEQGILGTKESQLGQLVSFLHQLGYPFKSMGAGNGDCFWVLAKRSDARFANAIHPVTGKSLAESIVIDWAESTSV